MPNYGLPIITPEYFKLCLTQCMIILHLSKQSERVVQMSVGFKDIPSKPCDNEHRSSPQIWIRLLISFPQFSIAGKIQNK